MLVPASSRAQGEDPGAPLSHPVIYVGQPPVDFSFGAGILAYPRLRGFGPPIVRTTGANLFRLDPDGTVTNLTRREAAVIRNPDVSFDGTRVLYAMALGQEGRWQIHEMNVDGTGDRRVSNDWNFNDLDPAYLPDGRIVFVSDRRKVVDPYLWLPSAQLHVMNADGTGVTQLSCDPGGESSPHVLSSGEIGFIRWDVKITHDSVGDPLDVSRFLPWKMNPDGTNDGHPAFGAHAVRDFTGGFHQARELRDGTRRLIAVSSGDVYFAAAGSLVRLDPAGNQDQHGSELLAGGSGASFWRDPFPLADGRIVASFSPRSPSADFGQAPDPTAPGFGLVLTDADGRGRRTLRDDPALWEWEPVEVAARPVPPVIASTLDRTQSSGILNSKDVTLRGINPYVAEPDRQGLVGDAAGLKVRIYRSRRSGASVAYPYGSNGYAAVEPVLLGEAPVAEGGSFAARVPAGTPLIWEVVDADGNVLVKERFWNQVLPGQTQTCNGCHSPHDGTTGRITNLALAAPTALVAEDPLPAKAAAALDAARTAVSSVRSALDAIPEAPANLAARVARAELALSRAETAIAAPNFAAALRLARRAKSRAEAVTRRLGADGG